MIPVGQSYRAAGPLSPRAILTTLILGLTTAALAAGIIWAWESSPIPTLVIITPAIQGIALGGLMAFFVYRLRMRNPKLVVLITLLCGLGSVLMVHYGHYRHLVSEISQELRKNLVEEPPADPEQAQAMRQELAVNPDRIINNLLVAETGHSGFLGSLLLRARQGFMIKNAPVTGTGVWLVWGFEALIVVGLAISLPTAMAAAPFCEECNEWCGEQKDQHLIAGEHAENFAAAVVADDPARLVPLGATPRAAESLAGATLHTCATCDLAFADVWHRHEVTKGKKTETKSRDLAKRVRVSPEMLALLRTQPGRSVVAEAKPGEQVTRSLLSPPTAERQE